jgi:hypothetical protein
VSTSQIFGALDALVAQAKTSMPAGVDVYDGPINALPARDFLLIGCDNPHNQGAPIVGVDGASDWAALGAQRRDETFSIHNVYVAFSSDPNLTTSRARAKTNIGLLETALRQNPGITLSGALNNPGWVAVVIHRLDQVNTGDGVQVHVHFDVVCRGRI